MYSTIRTSRYPYISLNITIVRLVAAAATKLSLLSPPLSLAALVLASLFHCKCVLKGVGDFWDRRGRVDCRSTGHIEEALLVGNRVVRPEYVNVN